MRVAVNYRKEQKRLKKIALHLMSTLARPPIYNRAYPKKRAAASPGNAKDVSRPSLLLLLGKQNEKFLEGFTTPKEIYVFTSFGKKSLRKIRSESKIA